MKVEKHLYITSTSTVSWKDAIVKAITEASKTIENISSVKIIEQKADIQKSEISLYHVDLDLCFIINKDRGE